MDDPLASLDDHPAKRVCMSRSDSFGSGFGDPEVRLDPAKGLRKTRSCILATSADDKDVVASRFGSGLWIRLPWSDPAGVFTSNGFAFHNVTSPTGSSCDALGMMSPRSTVGTKVQTVEFGDHYVAAIGAFAKSVEISMLDGFLVEDQSAEVDVRSLTLPECEKCHTLLFDSRSGCCVSQSSTKETIITAFEMEYHDDVMMEFDVVPHVKDLVVNSFCMSLGYQASQIRCWDVYADTYCLVSGIGVDRSRVEVWHRTYGSDWRLRATVRCPAFAGCPSASLGHSGFVVFDRSTNRIVVCRFDGSKSSEFRWTMGLFLKIDACGEVCVVIGTRGAVRVDVDGLTTIVDEKLTDGFVKDFSVVLMDVAGKVKTVDVLCGESE